MGVEYGVLASDHYKAEQEAAENAELAEWLICASIDHELSKALNLFDDTELPARTITTLESLEKSAERVANAPHDHRYHNFDDLAHEITSSILIPISSIVTQLDHFIQTSGRHLTATRQFRQSLIKLQVLISGLIKYMNPSTPTSYSFINVRRLIDNIISTLRPSLLNQSVPFRRPQVFGNASMKGDPNLIELVVRNLINNAFGHNRTMKGLRVSVGIRDVSLQLLQTEFPYRFESCSRPTDWIAITVADNGTGLPASRHARLGLFQVGRTGPESRGSGLGLALALFSACRMGGDILANGRIRQGSRFTLLLPTDVPRYTKIPPIPFYKNMETRDDF